MRRAILAAAALGAGLFAWWWPRIGAPEPFPGFRAEPVPDAAQAPFFRSVVIDPQTREPMSHSATLVECPDGTLAAAWYAGTAEAHGDVKIWFAARSRDGAWSAPRVIFDRDGVTAAQGRFVVSLGNPALLTDDSGRLWLLFVTISAGRWSGSSINYSWSDDRGATWAPPRRMFLDPFFNFSALPRSAPSALEGGGWALPVYNEFIGKFPALLWLQARGDRLEYAKSRMAGGVSILQPAVVPLARERAVAFFRDFTKAGLMPRAETADGGRTWTAAVATGLPNGDAGMSAVRLPDGRLLCAFNDFTPPRRNRFTLRLAVSADEGRTWTRIANIDKQEDRDASYPFMILGRDGVVRMVYTFRGTNIRCAEFNAAWVDEQAARVAAGEVLP